MFSSSWAWWFSNVYFLFSSASACPMKPELWSRAASWAELQCWAENINVPTMVLLSCCEIVKQDMASQRGRSAYRRTAEERSNPLGSSHLHPNQVHGAGGISSKFWPLLWECMLPRTAPGDGKDQASDLGMVSDARGWGELGWWLGAWTVWWYFCCRGFSCTLAPGNHCSLKITIASHWS